MSQTLTSTKRTRPRRPADRLHRGPAVEGLDATESAPPRPATVAQLQLARSLQHNPRVQRQMQLAESLNRRATVRELAQRQAASPGMNEAVVQRVTKGQAVLTTAGMAGGAYLGSYLDSVLPYGLGTIGGGLAGGLTGYFLPSLTRWALSKPLDREMNQSSRSYKTWNTPQMLADQLAASSSEFHQLRSMAQAAVRRIYGQDLTYKAGDTSRTGGHTAAFSDGTVWIDESFHPAITVQNLIFETANAAQSTFFAQVRADWQDDSILENSLRHYAGLLGRRPGDLDRSLSQEYEKGNKNARRSLLQEWAEWNSLNLARAAFGQLQGRFRDETARDYWELGFADRLNQDSFTEYYKEYGKRHRAAVQSVLDRSSESKKNQ